MVASVTVAPASSTIVVGGSASFTASAFDAASAPINGATFTWVSSNPAVATVSASGVVTGVAVGGASISATAANGVGSSATVTVNEAPPPPTGDFHITEIHYDNLNADTGEAIEIEGPAGADVTGFSVVLYNGNGGVVYNTQTLSGVLPVSCTDRGVVVVTYPPDGIQNGAPDGMALVNASGQVIEFLSYEGVFAATAGPAAGLTSVDIGAAQNSAPVGTSLARDSSNAWAPGRLELRRLQSRCAHAGQQHHPVHGPHAHRTWRCPWASKTSCSRALGESVEQHRAQHLHLGSADAGHRHDRCARRDSWRWRWAMPRSAPPRRLMAPRTPGRCPSRVAVASATAQYANNTEFGEPMDSDPTDDWIIERPQYTQLVEPESRLAQLGGLRDRRHALRRRRPLRLLHHGRGPAVLADPPDYRGLHRCAAHSTATASIADTWRARSIARRVVWTTPPRST